jgi:tRNA dimethylallyltransferase
MVSAKKPLILVIVGETASGKSELALKIAKQFNGEIISADSRTVYKGLDIATAKPIKPEQEEVPHWGLDLIHPDEKYSAGQFKHYAEQKIKEIRERGKLPILVGGTGLYIDSVLFDYKFSPPGAERDQQNPRHLKKAQTTDTKMRSDALVIGLKISRDELKIRLTERVEKMVGQGLIEEVRHAAKLYGWEANALLAPGYKAFRGYIEDKTSLVEAKAVFVKNDLDLAKRQRTWFRRNKFIHWFPDVNSAFQEVYKLLNT